MTAVVAMEAVVSIVTEMIAAGPGEGETEETIGYVTLGKFIECLHMF